MSEPDCCAACKATEAGDDDEVMTLRFLTEATFGKIEYCIVFVCVCSRDSEKSLLGVSEKWMEA